MLYGSRRTGAKGSEIRCNEDKFSRFKSTCEAKRQNTTAGSADICLICAQPLEEILEELKSKGVTPIDGIVARSGTNGKIRSLYLRDPDGNLLELSNYV
ncbi:VOC family protein [Campylobacter curvus]|uniref:VOC family protein n=1 Tax=Campylobacter curvus TaxID=200 RepID=UPI0020166859|nr:VOC family protein [Campylobacter curvus]